MPNLTTVTILLAAPITPRSDRADIGKAFASLNGALARREIAFAFCQTKDVDALRNAATDSLSVPLALVDPADAVGSKEAAKALSGLRSATNFTHQRPAYVLIPISEGTSPDALPAFEAALEGGCPVLPFSNVNDVVNLADMAALISLLETRARFATRAIVAANGDPNASTKGRRAAALAIAGRYDEAIDALNGVDDADSSGQRLLATLLLMRADSETSPEGADAAFSKAVEANPKSVNLRIEHMLYLEHAGNSDGAIKEAEQQHRENRQNLRLAKTLFDLLAAHGSIPASRVVDQQDIRSNGRLKAPGRARHALEAAMLFEATGASQDARDQYKTAEKNLKGSGENWLPEYALALTGHARMLASLHKPSEALKRAHAAAPIWRQLNKGFNGRWISEEARNLVLILDNGIGAIEAGERGAFLERAIAVLTAAAESAPDSSLPTLARALNYHANIQCDKRNFDAAREELDKARTLYEALAAASTDPDAKKQLSRSLSLCVMDQARMDDVEFASTQKSELRKAMMQKLEAAGAGWHKVSDKNLTKAYKTHCETQGRADWKSNGSTKAPASAAAPQTPPTIPTTPPPVPSASSAKRATPPSVPATPPPVPTTPPPLPASSRATGWWRSGQAPQEPSRSSAIPATETKRPRSLEDQLRDFFGEATFKGFNGDRQAIVAELRAMAARNATSRFLLGWCLEEAWGCSKNPAEALRCYKEAGKAGNVDAIYRAARCHMLAIGTAKNLPLAIQQYRTATKRGHAGASYYLGCCYRDGRGVPQDLSKATELFREAANQGHAPAQNWLGWCYQNGVGVDTNPQEAVKWYRKAADQGYDRAKEALAKLEPSKADTAEAQQAREDRTATPDSAAQTATDSIPELDESSAKEAQRLHDEGVKLSLTKSMAEGFVLFKQAAKLGHVDSMYRMGDGYARGRGIDKDLAQAHRWLSLAAERGHAKAAASLEELSAPSAGPLEDLYAGPAGTGRPSQSRSAGAGTQDAPTQDTAESPSTHRADTPQRSVPAPSHAQDVNELFERGLALLFGNGVQKDEAKGIEILLQAAEAGHASAQHEIGNCYEKGVGVEKNPQTAVEWYRKAAEQGHERAAEALAALEPSKADVAGA